MRKRTFQYLGLMAGIVLFGHSFASKGDAPSQTETLALLRDNAFAELDHRYSEIQSAYKKGSITDEELLGAFHAFYGTDPSFEAHYNLWTSRMPTSYVAHLAHGIYYVKVGEERRGNKPIGDTVNTQIVVMKQMFDLATGELRTSFSLDDRPLLSYLYLLNIGNFLGQGDEIIKMLNLSINIAPSNFIVRRAYMRTLETRWGGSVAQMADFLSECRKARLSTNHMRELQSMIEEDRGWVDTYQNHDLDAAAHDYIKGAKLDPASNCSICAAETLRDQGQYKEAIKFYSKAIAADPKSATTFYNRGFTFIQMHKSREALADLERAGNLGSAVAQDALGRVYVLGAVAARDGGKGIVVSPDRDKGIDWLRKAANQGYVPAQILLPMAMDKNIPLLPEPAK
jgi:tetratricopeptide (TPR) repeat protein